MANRNSSRISILSMVCLVLGLIAVVLPRQAGAQAISIDHDSVPQLQNMQQGGTMNQVRPTGVATEGIGDVTLSSGSLIALHVVEESDLDGSYRLDGAGDINIPYVGVVGLNGLKLFDAEKVISDQYIRSGILKVAHVTVNIVEYSTQDVTVLGEVKQPGQFPILGSRTLFDVLAMAGGETPLAGDEIDVHRHGQNPNTIEKVTYRRNADEVSIHNLKIYPGDTVSVKRTGFVYVLGSVLRSGGYPMQEDGQLNIAQALALAMGLSPDAKTHAIRVLRKSSDGSIEVIPVSYDKIRNGPESTFALREQDVVFVPNSRFKDTLEFAKSIFSSASSAAIYVYH